MKLSWLLIFALSLQSSAEKILSLDSAGDPEYLTLEMEPGNETHFGAKTVTLLKKVGQVSISILAFSRGDKLMMNMTRVVCNGKKSAKIAGYVKEMFAIGFDRKNFGELKCPIEEGTIVLPGLRRIIRLPLLIPSFLAIEGKGEINSSVTISSKGQKKIILQTSVKFLVQNIPE